MCSSDLGCISILNRPKGSSNGFRTVKPQLFRFETGGWVNERGALERSYSPAVSRESGGTNLRNSDPPSPGSFGFNAAGVQGGDAAFAAAVMYPRSRLPAAGWVAAAFPSFLWPRDVVATACGSGNTSAAPAATSRSSPGKLPMPTAPVRVGVAASLPRIPGCRISGPAWDPSCLRNADRSGFLRTSPIRGNAPASSSAARERHRLLRPEKLDAPGDRRPRESCLCWS